MSLIRYCRLMTVIAGISFLTACGNGGSNNVAFGGGSTGTGTATLTWDAPATRADGSPLNSATDLQSYKLYYGTSAQVYSASISLPNPGTTPVSYALDLPQGTYYFAVTDIDQYGQESGYSTEVIKVL